MNILQKVTINGFWGDRNIEINLQPDINFLIGVNGSGKTTAINLIAAALNADFMGLDRLPFNKIVIHLAEIGGKKRPQIEIEKRPREHSPFSKITYRVKGSASDKAITFSLEDLEEQLLLRHYPVGYYQRQIRKTSASIIEHLKKLINSSWLSIHRAESTPNSPEDRSYESTVDRKLDNLSNEFVKFFSFLTKQAADESNKFQKEVFLSLIPRQTEGELFLAVKKLDLDKEEKALIEIFREFKLGKNSEEVVNEHFKTLESAVREIEKNKGLGTNALVAVVSALRTHSVVQDWNNLVEVIRKIYEPRDTFVEIINSMMQRKALFINEKNELIAKTQSGKILPLKSLSSGEKQLLIILGEALLQERLPWVYIADEPELSLHISWQDKLIVNLRKINPNAQIFFATHSPDIVSCFGNRVIDMEKILQ
ncbi:MAG: AAA family ATPase [Deltaproteobacteria bacterium]|nr:AAA family ATPase [Deltaproteobacteria bacterium]